MSSFLAEESTPCKYCKMKLQDSIDEGLKCIVCSANIHVRCLVRGSVPGGLHGDIFYTFTCSECSENQTEVFERDKLSWLQIIVLVLYHLHFKSNGLARKGFFHWRYHIGTFIDKNWDIIFKKDVKKKKKWTGTVAGTLSHFSVYFFLSGTSVFKEQAWWTLKYPKLSPNTITKLYNVHLFEKHKLLKASKLAPGQDLTLFTKILEDNVSEDLLVPFRVELESTNTESSSEILTENESEHLEENVANIKQEHEWTDIPNNAIVQPKPLPVLEKRSLDPLLFERQNKRQKLHSKLLKLNTNSNSSDGNSDDNLNFCFKRNKDSMESSSFINGKDTKNKNEEIDKKGIKLLDPFCHFNTSLNSLSRIKGQRLVTKLIGNTRKEMILSPYSGIYLKPYIRRDSESFPLWLRLMAEVQVKANKSSKNFTLPSRSPLDYTYVQPEHIPAINCLCNQFFWPGIDLTDTLQYPDFSCVVQYKKLIVGFAFLVPNVSHTESYISFIFVRPGWRNIGIAKFMLYHLIQTSLGKDITLHVSINNSALFLYQKFGFKVEHVVLDFYDKYFRSDTKDSKHAFFCRLER